MLQPTTTFKTDILSAVPQLRAFAISLAGLNHADDMVQETLLRAWANSDKFIQGTNIRAWLFTILRNNFYTSLRKTKREVADPDGFYAGKLASAPAQEHSLELKNLAAALSKLNTDQREAIILVGMQGMMYEEVAGILKCSIGTVKSRVHRARQNLMYFMSVLPSTALIPAPQLLKAH